MQIARFKYWVILLLVCAPVVACSSLNQTQIESQWKDEGFASLPVSSMLIIGISENMEKRKVFEDAFVKFLAEEQVNATPSYSIISNIGELNKELAKDAAEQNGMKTVLVTRLIDVKDRVEYYAKGSMRQPQAAIYYKFDEYYPEVRKDLASGYYAELKTAILESNLYDIESEKLIWHVQSKTIDAKSSAEALNSVCKAMVKEMKANKIIN